MVSEIQVALALVEKDGRLLVSRRSAGRVFAGYWEFPGGRIEQGETPEEAAIREVREETGLEVEITGNRGQVITEHQGKRIVLHMLQCRFVRGTPMVGDASITDVRWVTLKELTRLPMPPANAEIIRSLTCTEGSHKKHDE